VIQIHLAGVGKQNFIVHFFLKLTELYNKIISILRFFFNKLKKMNADLGNRDSSNDK
jgi:hypothetical protein